MPFDNPPSKRNGNGSWVDMRLTLGNLLVLGTMLFYGVGFYYTTKSQIDSNSVAIKTGLERDEWFRTELRRIDLEDRAEREKIRLEITVRAENATSAVAMIHQRLAVIETKLEEVKAQLQRMSEQRGTR